MTYTLKRSNRKTLSIRITADKAVIVSAPLKMPLKTIEDFIAQKQTWIDKHTKNKTSAPYILGKNTIFILGQAYTKNIILSIRNYVEICPHTRIINIHVRHERYSNDTLKKYFFTMSRQYLTERFLILKKQARILCLTTPYPVQFKYYRRRWGCCSGAGQIILNDALYHLPPQLIDYVIKHEFCHLRFMNHSKDFYGLLAKFDILSDIYRQSIKKYHHVIGYFD